MTMVTPTTDAIMETMDDEEEEILSNACENVGEQKLNSHDGEYVSGVRKNLASARADATRFSNQKHSFKTKLSRCEFRVACLEEKVKVKDETITGLRNSVSSLTTASKKVLSVTMEQLKESHKK